MSTLGDFLKRALAGGKIAQAEERPQEDQQSTTTR